MVLQARQSGFIMILNLGNAELVVAFNDLEVALGGALMYLLKQDEEVGSAFTAHLGAATKIRLLQDLDREN